MDEQAVEQGGFEISSSSETPEQISAAIAPAEETIPQADGDGGHEVETDQQKADRTRDEAGRFAKEEQKKADKADPHRNPVARMQKATAEAAQAKREADEARRQAFTLQQEIERLRATSKPAEEAPKAVKTDNEPAEEDFDSYKDFVSARARWEIRQELDARATEARKHEHEAAIREASNSRAETFQGLIKEAGDGFLDTVSQDVLYLNPDEPLGHAITSSPQAPRLMSYFTEHPDELHALSGVHPAQVYREIGRIEGKLGGAVSAGTTPRAVSVSKAKPPVRPVTGTPSSGGELPDDAPFEEFVKHANAARRLSLR